MSSSKLENGIRCSSLPLPTTLCMFAEATSFNQPLDNWNVSNVTDMVGMFESTRFNQPRHAPWYHSSEESEDESDVDSDSE